MNQGENKSKKYTKWYIWLLVAVVVISMFEWSPQQRLVDFILSSF